MAGTNSANKKQTIGAIVFVCVLLLALAGFSIFSYFKTRIKMNPEGTIGNLAGNINNSGLFCESDGKVYFANSYDGGSLYSMDVNEGNLKKLNSSQCRNILCGGDHIYYFQLGATGDSGFGSVRVPRSFNRCDKNGKNITAITRETVINAQLSGNYIYMLISGNSDPYFSKIKIDKSDEKKLADYIINPACAVGDTIYYNGTVSDHNLYALDTTDDSFREILEGNIWFPVYDSGYIYYVNVDDNYRLYRYSLSSETSEKLTDDRVEYYNVGYGLVYYSTAGNEPQLIRMLSNGSEKAVIANGVFNNINLTSQYVYFQEFGNEGAMYHSLLGSTYVESFNAAQSAVLSQKQ